MGCRGARNVKTCDSSSRQYSAVSQTIVGAFLWQSIAECIGLIEVRYLSSRREPREG